MTFLPICCFDTIIHSVCVCVSARILLLCKCLVLGLRSTIYVRMYCTWSFQVFGTRGAMSLIYTEICNIVVYPARCIRSYLHNSQAQLLLMGMHVENTVKKLELVVLVFLEVYKVRGPCHLCTRILYIAAHELRQNV